MASYSIGGHVYGSGLNHEHDVRPPQFFRLVPSARRILELGSCQGGGTFRLAVHPGVQQVVGVEVRDYHIEKARFVQQALGISNVTFIEANLETFDLSSLGRFDAIYCVGLLYHLPSPWELLAKLPAVSDVVYLNTHFCRASGASLKMHGYEGEKWGEKGYEEPLSGMSVWSFWPTLASLAKMLIDTGFVPEIIETDSTGVGQSPHGTTIVARCASSLSEIEKERLSRKLNNVLSSLPADCGSEIGSGLTSRMNRAMARLKRAGQQVWGSDRKAG